MARAAKTTRVRSAAAAATPLKFTPKHTPPTNTTEKAVRKKEKLFA
ncbi:MAG: hypothetical protein QXW47_05990 [Candidatus Jordarchaeales archaeon]